MAAALRKPAAEEPTSTSAIPANWQRFVAERDARDAYLNKPMALWTEAEWAEFHRYENDTRKWTRSW
ncbi:hypothetical protein V5F32_05055 [Xanthobacter oligotrophicus]|uniref:Uncharacterized protein n=1 Tax=Xanthobacter oligotrophicus TaxID=2607286 RepID=A0ABW6ZS31_9HYPH